MKIEFSRTFEKDLERILDAGASRRFRKAIEEVRQAKTLSEIRNLKRVTGKPGYCRIRVGDYRIGIEVAEDRAFFLRCLHRKEIYRYFP